MVTGSSSPEKESRVAATSANPQVGAAQTSDGRSGSSSWIRRLQGNRQVQAIELALLAAGSITLLWGLVQVFAGSDDFDVHLWIRETAPIYPSSQTDDMSLPLTYDGRPAEAITVLQLQLVNRGTEPVGQQAERFTIDIVAPNADRLVLVDEPTVVETVAASTAGAEPNSVRLEVGLLPPRAHVDFVVMVIDPEKPGFPRLRVESGLDGLPSPQVTTEGPDRLFAVRLMPPIVVLVAVVLLVGYLLELRSDPTPFREHPVRYVARSVAWWVGLSFFSGVLLALGLGWVLAVIDRLVGG